MKFLRLGIFLFVLILVVFVVIRKFPFSPAFVALPLPTYRPGETFPLKIEVENVSHSINAVQLELSYDPAYLEVLNVSTVGSFASVFLDKEIDNERGQFKLSGGIPSPGFKGPRGLFATVIFHARQTGPAQVKFLPSSQIFLNDGKGTNVLKNFQTVGFVISPNGLSQREEEKQKKDILGAHVLGAQSSREQIFLDAN